MAPTTDPEEAKRAVRNRQSGRRQSVVEAGGVDVTVMDHKGISAKFWSWDMDTLREATVAIPDLRDFLQTTLAASLVELHQSKEDFDRLNKDERRRRVKDNALPRSEVCRWFHLPGSNFEAVDLFHEFYKLHGEVADQCKGAASKPACSWHQQTVTGTGDATFDHLFVVGHYIIPSGDVDTDGIQGFQYEQCQIIYIPDLNTLISIDGNGEKTWDGVVDLLTNVRGFVRTSGDTSCVLYKLLDSMIDEVYPVLDIYVRVPTLHHARCRWAMHWDNMWTQAAL